uniref:Uncharacterized protein n=1 Tax=Utricularia reniformis TaxID=192314 RepID=A0A1Y0B2I0_9LAMI|nr:hypothetical protein AEK19_MT1402 [Utricularia reniformis]ART31597.1 hypothetical protein AEK19_MT1402 [Utricularia reniformis]
MKEQIGTRLLVLEFVFSLTRQANINPRCSSVSKARQRRPPATSTHKGALHSDRKSGIQATINTFDYE